MKRTRSMEARPYADFDRDSKADAVVEQEDGLLLFVEPLEISESFSEFLEYLRNDTKLAGAARCGRNVKYAQTRK